MATASATIQLDSALQRESQELFESFGLTLDAAIAMFLRQSVREQAIPFRVGQPIYNEETRKAIEDARRGIGLSIKARPLWGRATRRTGRGFYFLLRRLMATSPPKGHRR